MRDQSSLTHHRMRLLASVVALGASMGALGFGPASASASGPNPNAFLADAASNDRARTLGEKLHDRLIGEPNYAGVRITSDGIEVSVVGAPTTTETAVVSNASAVASVPVKYRTVSHTLAELTAVTSRIDSDNADLHRSGIELSSWGPVEGENAVVVHLRQYSDSIAKRLESKYGDAISVDTAAQNATASSRTADYAPWYGGDAISQGGTGCTSWFSATKAGAPVGATSGHCGGGTWTQNGSTYGTVSARAFGGSMDGEIMPVASNSGYVWADPGATTRAVKSVASNDLVGTSFCTDGITNREVCGVYVYSTNQSVNYDGQTITGLVYGVKESGQATFSAGNSGGPVYTIGSTGVTAVGMVEARVTNSDSQGWYMPARTVQSYFGITIKTA